MWTRFSIWWGKLCAGVTWCGKGCCGCGSSGNLTCSGGAFRRIRRPQTLGEASSAWSAPRTGGSGRACAVQAGAGRSSCCRSTPRGGPAGPPQSTGSGDPRCSRPSNNSTAAGVIFGYGAAWSNGAAIRAVAGETAPPTLSRAALQAMAPTPPEREVGNSPDAGSVHAHCYAHSCLCSGRELLPAVPGREPGPSQSCAIHI